MNLDKKTTELANTRIDLTDLTNKLEGIWMTFRHPMSDGKFNTNMI
jgi:hypothetical protein